MERLYIIYNIYIVGDAIVGQFVPPFARIFAIQPTVLDILRSRRMAGSDKGAEEGRALAFARRKMKFSATKCACMSACVCVCNVASIEIFHARQRGVGHFASSTRPPATFIQL